MPHYAHTLNSAKGQALPPEMWQLLSTHENNVALLAERFASHFGGGAWARLLGRWHDLGKYSPEFQHYLHRVTQGDSDSDGEGAHKNAPARGPDHSTAGAQHAAKTVPLLGHLIAYLIAGHHAGLPNGRDNTAACLFERLAKQVPDYSSAPTELLAIKPPSATHGILETPRFALSGTGYTTAFFMRMLFSALVDADYLDTEAFMNQAGAAQRAQLTQPTIAELAECLHAHMKKRFGATATHTHISDVQRERAAVLTACRQAAGWHPGLFTLTVPTGGGKTLASMAFALDHARQHGLERIIYVIPFTSIIEQNAAVFRDAFAPLGEDIVLEHHSNLDTDTVQKNPASRLATENWDARIIVTTNVQFFESLHARETSRCRKLHRLARSVIILDEAQTLPVTFLQPCLRSIEQLTKNYGSTVVLCTATQPAIAQNETFKIGLPASELREIIPDPARLHHALKRIKPVQNLGTLSDEKLALRLAAHERVLCIVNTRAHARELYEHVAAISRTAAGASDNESENTLHLSALMCPEHRSEVIDRIRARLKSDKPCRVISTSLIEAGVDLDFPAVYRELAGIDSIAQAAGRCNREGRLAGCGDVFVFCGEKPAPAGFMRETAQAAAQILETHPQDALSLTAIKDYFDLYYWKKEANTDEKGILTCFPATWIQDKRQAADALERLQFRDCSERFQLIEESGYKSVIVPWKPSEALTASGKPRADGQALCEELRKTFNPAYQRRLLRRLQRFIVQIPEHDYNAATARGIIENIHDRYPMLASNADYSPVVGLQLHIDIPYAPENLISV